MEDRRRAFLQSAMGTTLVERAGGLGARTREHSGEVPWVTTAGAWARPRRVAGVVLKALARGLWLSPLLILLRLQGGRVGSLAVVAFVGVVVLFFLALNVYVVVSVVDHRLGERPRWLRPYPNDPLGLLRREVAVAVRGGGTARPGQWIEVHGRAAALAGRTPDLVVDLWALDATPPYRLTEAQDLAVAAEGQPTVIVRWKTAPVVLARPRASLLVRSPLGAVAQQLLDAHLHPSDGEPRGGADALREPVERLVVPAGAEVVLVGRVAAAIDDVSAYLASEAAADEDPYRPKTSRRGLLVESTLEAPAVIQVK